MHINDNFKLVKSFNSVFPPNIKNNYPTYDENNLNFVNKCLPNHNKDILSRFDLAFRKLNIDMHFKLVKKKKSFNSVFPSNIENNYPTYNVKQFNFC